MKTALGLFLGIILGFTLDSFAKFLGQTVQPLPPDLMDQGLEHVRNWYEAAAPTQLFYLPMSWFIGGLTGSFISERLSDWAAYIAGMLTVAAMYTIGLLFLAIGPQPTWAWWLLGISQLVGGIAGSWLGIGMKNKDTARRTV